MSKTTSTQGPSLFQRCTRGAVAFALLGLIQAAACAWPKTGSEETRGTGKQDVEPGQGARTCMQSCSAASDCIPQEAPQSADGNNFACSGGVCQYLGCKSHQECVADNGPGSECRTAPGGGMAVCVRTCAAPADCVSGEGSEEADLSHVACNDGVCESTGCLNHQDCAGAGEGMECRPIPGTSQAMCVRTCSAPADCTSSDAPLMFDASHWACQGGVCTHLGCKNDQECSQTFGEGIVCR